MTPSATAAAEPRVYTLGPAKGLLAIRLREIWEYRELTYFLIWREVRVRYKQTALGVLWAILQPVMTMVVFSLFFGRLGKFPSDGLPYPVFTYCALLPWQLFASGLSESSNSVVLNQRLVTKVYFPRLILPISSVCVGLIDFALSFLVLLALMAYYHVTPGLAIWTIPFWALLSVTTALAAGLWFSALNVRYRDIRYTLPFLTQLWLVVTPVAYSSSLFPPAWRSLYALNPMVGVVDGFRWALLGASPMPATALLASLATIAVVLVTGVFYFRRVEHTFADMI